MSTTPPREPLPPTEFTRLRDELDLIARDLLRVGGRLNLAYGGTMNDMAVRASNNVARLKQALVTRQEVVGK
jgi:hypothetical protein